MASRWNAGLVSKGHGMIASAEPNVVLRTRKEKRKPLCTVTKLSPGGDERWPLEAGHLVDRWALRDRWYVAWAVT